MENVHSSSYKKPAIDTRNNWVKTMSISKSISPSGIPSKMLRSSSSPIPQERCLRRTLGFVSAIHVVGSGVDMNIMSPLG
jgi:hypothetical protein